MGHEERLLMRLARVEPVLDEDTRRLMDGTVNWERFWALARRHQVVALCWVPFAADPELRRRLPDDLAARVARVHFATGIRTADRTAEALRILAALDAAGAPGMPVKGIALVHDLYGGRGVRTFEDIDVLVRARDLRNAQGALGALGYRTRAVPTFEETVHRFHDLQYFGTLAGSSQCLELHWDLWDPRLHRSDADGLWDRARTVRIGDRDVTMLSHEDTLMHLAIHRTRAPLRLRFVCDVAELVRAHSDRIDWDAVAARASRLSARTALHVVLNLASDLLDAPVPDRTLRMTSPGPARRAILERTCGTTAMFRPAADDDLGQQPHLVLRALELDGSRAIVAAGARAGLRKIAKWRYARRTGRAMA